MAMASRLQLLVGGIPLVGGVLLRPVRPLGSGGGCLAFSRKISCWHGSHFHMDFFSLAHPIHSMSRSVHVCAACCDSSTPSSSTSTSQLEAQESPHQEVSPITGEYSPITWELWRRRSYAQKPLSENAQKVPHGVELKPKTPAQSRTSITYALSTDSFLRAQYGSPFGHVRIARLLEDLDSLAGNIAFAHVDDDDPSTIEPTLVTASVDSIRVKRRLSLNDDIVLSGEVTHVGRSSLEISMRIEESDKKKPPAVQARFTFVARDRETGKAAPVPGLLPETEEEKRAFAAGDARAVARKQARSIKPMHQEMSDEEAQLVADLLKESKVLMEMPALAPGDVMLARATRQENLFMTQPQQRNMNGRVFGGFLMRRAFELAYATAFSFCGMPPRFLEVGEVTFKQPVSVGELLSLRAEIRASVDRSELSESLATAYSRAAGCGPGLSAVMQVDVSALVTDPPMRTAALSNTFVFRFGVDAHDADAAADDSSSSSPVMRAGLKRVLPAKESEAVAQARALLSLTDER